MPILIIQLRPEDKAANSEFKAILTKSRLPASAVVRIRGEQTSFRNISLQKYSAIIVGGSPFDITKPEREKSDQQKRIESDFAVLIPKIIKYDFPFLGACSGNGLLSLFAGGVMSKKHAEPVGGVDIFITKEGKDDKLLKGFPTKFRALVGHKEACQVPPKRAVILASSQTCPIQMLRLGENVYSTQFHPEADAKEFELRIKIYKNYGYFPAEKAEELTQTIKSEKIVWPVKILERFAKFYQK